MALEIEIPKEIDDYKEKYIAGLTFRGILATVFILAADVPLYFAWKDKMSMDTILQILTLVSAPAAFLGFMPFKNGLAPEKQFMNLLNFYTQKQSREFVDLPIFWYAREEIIADNSAKQRACKKLKRGKRK
jgi:hypothetical protein